MEFVVQYPKNYIPFAMIDYFYRRELKIVKFEELLTNLYNKKNILLSNIKFRTSIKSWMGTKKVHRVIKFNQETWLISYTDMNAEVRKKAKYDF